MLIEIAVAVADIGADAREGDIIVARLPVEHFGIHERRLFLWMSIDTSIPVDDFLPVMVGGRKVYPYRIDLNALAGDGIDLDKVKARTLAYQPYTNYAHVGRVYRWKDKGFTGRAVPSRKRTV